MIRDKIRESEMQDHVILLGKRKTPIHILKPVIYMFSQVDMKENVLRCGRHRCCKPVVITKYATAFSQLQDGYDGMIVPMDNEGCADGIAYTAGQREKDSC